MFFCCFFLLCTLKSFADILNRLLKLSLQNYENFLFYIFQLMLPKCVLFFCKGLNFECLNKREKRKDVHACLRKVYSV